MRRDEAYLLDMLIAAREAVEFVSGMTWEEFSGSRLHQNAVMKSLENIGEAASHVSEAARQLYPQIPWRQIVGMRHRLVHGYFEVNVQRIWETVQTDIPALLRALEPLVPPEE